ncbi:MAG: hypothetical protein ACOZCL_00565 [Bacillota bacterium]
MDIGRELGKDRIIISNPEKYDNVEIRYLTYDDGEGLAGYNGNVVIGYTETYKDIFFLSINSVSEREQQIICDKIEEMFGQDNQLINLFVFNGDSTIFNLNDGENTRM